ncbi:MAG: hypothetical protein M4579_006993, partial [Chaenotheca gracillima]
MDPVSFTSGLTQTGEPQPAYPFTPTELQYGSSHVAPRPTRSAAIPSTSPEATRPTVGRVSKPRGGAAAGPSAPSKRRGGAQTQTRKTAKASVTAPKPRKDSGSTEADELQDSSDEHASSDDDGSGKRKTKRRRSGSDGEAAARKQRGRPRLDPQDENAVDRRRTQIRLAQRAYRQRKETTISSLKKRVALLENALKDAGESFFDFNDSALQSGVVARDSQLADRLQSLNDTFRALTKAAISEAEEELLDPSPDSAESPKRAVGSTRRSSSDDAVQTLLGQRSVSPPHSTHQPAHPGLVAPLGYATSPPEADTIGSLPVSDASPTSLVLSPRRALSDHDVQRLLGQRSMSPLHNRTQPAHSSLFESQHHPQSTHPGLVSPWGYQLNEVDDYVPPTSDGTAEAPYTHQSRQMHDVFDFMPMEDSSRQIGYTTPQYQGPPQQRYGGSQDMGHMILSPKGNFLEPPLTYSSSESTFARYLQRFTFEHAYKILSDPRTPTQDVAKVFALSLCFRSRDQILGRLRGIASKTSHDIMDNWGAPYLHWGGAGTHYPRLDADGRSLPIPNFWSVQSIGPYHFGPGQPIRNLSALTDHVDLSPFEGEWFDAHDVEGYLREKGVQFQGHGDYAEIDVEDSDLPVVDDASFPRSSFSAPISQTGHVGWQESQAGSYGLPTPSNGISSMPSSVSSVRGGSEPQTPLFNDYSYDPSSMLVGAPYSQPPYPNLPNSSAWAPIGTPVNSSSSTSATTMMPYGGSEGSSAVASRPRTKRTLPLNVRVLLR